MVNVPWCHDRDEPLSLCKCPATRAELIHALREAMTAMRIAAGLPAVDAEYDFAPAIKAVTDVLRAEPTP